MTTVEKLNAYLDVPLPAGGGVGGADDGVDGVTGGAGLQVHVLTSESTTEQGRVAARWVGDGEGVLSTVTSYT